MKALKIFFPVILLSLIVYHCSTVPITGRSQLSLISASEINALSFQQYDEFLKQNKLSTDAEKTNMVKRIGLNIKSAVETILRRIIFPKNCRDMPGNSIWLKVRK